MKNRRRRRTIVVLSALTFVGGFFALANGAILHSAADRTYNHIRYLPRHHVAIVLGCSPTLGKDPNPCFESRADRAAELYWAGKVDYLLVSGDNNRVDYDEPTAMEAALIQRQIPQKDIIKDYAGFRTLDSMVRAHKVFGLNKASVVTDDFHMPRALFCAKEAGLKADGFPSHVEDGHLTASSRAREVFARGQAVIDEVLHVGPKFLGKREAIP
ncbi:MAG: vancomycin high temperature exclusion protein [Armatimonadetes bacterium]|nr:vancomycin high temperature exclusion protein [Armatimonadota bacterium]